MRTFHSILLVPVIALGAACGRGAAPAADDALKADLALASQVQPFNPQQVVSPTEGGAAPQVTSLAPQAYRTSAARTATPARRTSTARRSSSGSARSTAGGGGGGGGYYPRPAAPREVIVKHTQRDAAIGAVAGAVIGATTSRNKVKGGVIGAAVGGILGGVIGNNVDKQKKVGW